MLFRIAATLTSFHPTGSPGSLEGGPRDRKGRLLITLEQHQSDPVTYPYCSVAGDFTVWPDGQRVKIPDIDPNAVFRIVDTGGHFYGQVVSPGELTVDGKCPNGLRHCKVIRNPGHEPLDVCVVTGHSIFQTADVYVVPGDSFDAGTIHWPDYLEVTSIPDDEGNGGGEGGDGGGEVSSSTPPSSSLLALELALVGLLLLG